MALVNEIRCIGYLGNDAVKNQTTAGHHVINFRLAVDDSYKKPDGTWENKTIWYECVLWADRRIEDLKAGNLVFITGTPRINEYQKKDGSGLGFNVRITIEQLKVLKFKDSPQVMPPAQTMQQPIQQAQQPNESETDLQF